MTSAPSAERETQLSTGVPGLDAVLGGGLPGRHVYLVQGRPGTGKTTMALQFLRAGVERGERCLFITLSQSRYELERIARSHGWTLDGIEVEELSTERAPEREQTVFYPIDVDLDTTRKTITDAIDRLKPQRLVYDSMVEIRHIAQDDLLFHRELLSFKKFLHDRGVATYLIDLEPGGTGELEMQSVAHGIFTLDVTLPTYGQARRRIDVSKMRGMRYYDGYHDLSITPERGVVVFPRIVPNQAPEAEQSELVRSDVKALDDMLGGGLEAGTVTLMVGQSGTGKSTLSSLYAFSALKRGEAVTVFLFEERPETFFRRSEGLQLPLRTFHEEGLLEIHDFNPNEVSQGRFSQIAQHAADHQNARVVVIDSLTGYLGGLAEPSEATVQMQLLLKYLSRSGVLTILVVAQRGLLGEQTTSDVDVSFLGDTVILLRMSEAPGEIRRSITVVKKRHGPHDMDVQKLTITGDGVSITPFSPPPQPQAG